MPSRKKTKGKARRAGKEAKEEDSQAVAAAANQRQQEESLEVEVQRLLVSPFAPNKCQHGLAHISPSDEKICIDFINAFITAYRSFFRSAECFILATESTMVNFADVYSSKLEIVVSILLNGGTQMILDGDNHNLARLNATLAFYFEEWMEVEVKESKAIFSWSKVYELHVADDHTLIQYYRKRIPCACLDEKYKEEKSVKKMGLCYNPNCSLPERKAERSKMFYCTRCRDANYCSVECQKDDWKKHRIICDLIVERKAAFNTNKQS